MGLVQLGYVNSLPSGIVAGHTTDRCITLLTGVAAVLLSYILQYSGEIIIESRKCI